MYGYSPRGKRCFARHDWHAKGRVNALGAMISGAGIGTCASLQVTAGGAASNIARSRNEGRGAAESSKVVALPS